MQRFVLQRTEIIKMKMEKSSVITYSVKAFGKLASNIEKYTNQGTLVGITGQMRSRKYDKDGQTHFVTELYVETIKFMSPKSQNNEILSDSILDIDSQNIDNHDLLEI